MADRTFLPASDVDPRGIHHWRLDVGAAIQKRVRTNRNGPSSDLAHRTTGSPDTPARSRGHRVKHNTWMLDRPLRPVGAMNVLILAAPFFALIAQPPGNSYTGGADLPGNPRWHFLGRKHRVEVGPPRACRPLRRGPGDSDLGPSVGSYAPRPGALLPTPVGASRFPTRATRERGVGVPSSRSLATTTREAT
jgi:hypothetical protein